MKNRSLNQKKHRVRPEPKQEPLISSLSEAQQIAMGFRNPRIVTPNFAKDENERKLLKKMHSNAKMKSNGGIPRKRRTEPLFNLTVHVVPNRQDKNYKSTHTFKAKRSEIYTIIEVFIGKANVAKAFYAGKPFIIH